MKANNNYGVLITVNDFVCAERGVRYTSDGDTYWLVSTSGIVGPFVCCESGRLDIIPDNIKIFDSRESANEFMKDYFADPWYINIKSFEVIKFS